MNIGKIEWVILKELKQKHVEHNMTPSEERRPMTIFRARFLLSSTFLHPRTKLFPHCLEKADILQMILTSRILTRLMVDLINFAAMQGFCIKSKTFRSSMISILTKDLKEVSPKSFVINPLVDVVNQVSLSLNAIWQISDHFKMYGRTRHGQLYLILEGRDDSLKGMPEQW